MTPDERNQLDRRFRASAPRVLRVFGIIFGLGAVVLAVGYFAGAGFDPDVVSWEILIVGVFAVGCAGAGSGMVRDPRSALESDEVLDMTAPVAALPSSPYGGAAFQLGSIGLQLPPTLAASVIAGQNQRVALALGLRPSQRAEPGAMRNRAYLLSVNGIPLAAPSVVRYEPMAAGSMFVPSPGPLAPGPPPMVFSPAPMAPIPPPFVPTPAPMVPSPAPATPSPPPPGKQVFCDKCGSPNLPDFRFCRSCGAPRPIG